MANPKKGCLGKHNIRKLFSYYEKVTQSSLSIYVWVCWPLLVENFGKLSRSSLASKPQTGSDAVRGWSLAPQPSGGYVYRKPHPRRLSSLDCLEKVSFQFHSLRHERLSVAILPRECARNLQHPEIDFCTLERG